MDAILMQFDSVVIVSDDRKLGVLDATRHAWG